MIPDTEPFVRILGVDMGLASIGTSILRVYRKPYPLVIEEAEFFGTQPQTKKLKIRVVDDMLIRLEEIGAFFERKMSVPKMVSVCVEAPSYNQKAALRNKLGLAYVYGTLREGCRRQGLPLLQANPQEIKKAFLGKSEHSTKEEVQIKMLELFPESEQIWPKDKGKKVHCVDAAAAAYVCSTFSQIQLAVNMRAVLG